MMAKYPAVAKFFSIPKVRIYMGLAEELRSEGLRLAKWGAPLAVFGAWMVWPAMTDSFKRTLGLLPALPVE